jgi:dihydroanticapsin dehydrogenase
VLVTGGGSNVARAVAALFAEQGAKLALADLDPSRIPPAEAGASERPLLIQADLTRAEAAEQLVRTTLASYGRIDVLCNTVGIDPPSATTLHETSEADWDRIMAVNLKSVFLSCKAVIPTMLERGGGAIVNVASQGALLTFPALAAYGVSKAAVLQLTRQIAADYGRSGIRANCVCPSGLELPSLDRRAGLEPERLARRAEVMRNATPLGRICTPLDVARAMLFLASELSGFVTGAALPVEGGATSVLRF